MAITRSANPVSAIDVLRPLFHPRAALAQDQEPGLRCKLAKRFRFAVAAAILNNADGRCRMHGGTSPGAPKGNKNAVKHGRYTADASARRRAVALLIRAARQLIG